MVTTSDQFALRRRRIRVGQFALVGSFAAVGLLTLVLPVGRTEFRSEFLHVPYVLALAGGAALTAWGTWVRFRMDGTSRAWLLSAAFGVLALLFAPHALYAGDMDPVGFFYGPASRLAFGLLLIVAMSPMPVPRVLRQPRTSALLLVLAVIAVVDVVLHADWVQGVLEPDPVRSNRLLETAALLAMGIALVQFTVKWVRTRRRILITWIAGVSAMAMGSALMIPASGWELRWWWAHLGLLVASAVFVLGTDRQMARAIDERELRLLYQPKVDLVSDELIGVEALLRWQHPDQGLVPAADFIPRAEETSGLITPFTLWAIREAITQHRRWLDEGLRIPVAVNVTARLLRDSSLIDVIQRELAAKQLDPSALSLELTESKALESEEAGAETLAALAASGVSIAVDDFGTGYSSLSYLRNLPVEVVKLDRSFVAPMASSHHDYTIVSSTLQMAHALGLKVVAEGIEDEQVAELLAQLGCETGQGYLWSRPLPPDELMAWARGRVAKPRERGEGGTYAAKDRANSQRQPGSVRRADEGTSPPKPAAENRERSDSQAPAVENADGDRTEQTTPLLRDLAPRAQDGDADELTQGGQSTQGPGGQQTGGG